MTQGNTAPLLPFGDPRPRTLNEVHDQLAAEMARLHGQDTALYQEAAALFKGHQAAKTDVAAAEALLAKVLALSAPANTPFPPQASAPVAENDPEPEDAPAEEADADVPGVEAAEEEEDTLDLEAPEASVEDTEDEASEEAGTEEDTPDEAPAQDAPPQSTEGTFSLEDALAAPLTLTPVAWTDGSLGAGLISQLAATLASGDMLSLVLTRLGDQLLVTVQPQPLKDEPAATAQALQAKGTPAALDTLMLPKLAEYRQGRDLARATVNYAAQVKAAAEAHQKSVAAAAKKNVKPPAGKSGPAAQGNGQLTVEVSPKDAVLVLQDADGKTHPLQSGKTASLPAGEYTLSVDAQGYVSQQEKLGVKAFKATKTAVVLKKEMAPALF
ncbi:hypothetical protein [Deinococcus aluminii]|uniref:PEGA domain-containing protein n=1 Tax=Deinococcus aluminii TaxID=1656885 RepID=A0ABP9XFF3_9DEIO